MKYKVILFDVNKESHDIITKETINDEKKLQSQNKNNPLESSDFSGLFGGATQI